MTDNADTEAVFYDNVTFYVSPRARGSRETWTFFRPLEPTREGNYVTDNADSAAPQGVSMNQEVRNQLIAAVWATLDATDGDEGVVRDEVELAIDAWSPQDDNAG